VNDWLALLSAQYAGAMGFEIEFLGSRSKSTTTCFDTLYYGEQLPTFFKNLVSVSHPSGACIGSGHGAIGDRAHDEGRQNGGSKRELHPAIQ
jgi:hypothetical protein